MMYLSSSKISQRRQWHPTPVLLPRKSLGQRSLVGCSPWGRWGSATSLSLFTFMHWRRKWQPTPVFLPGESQGRGSLVGCRLWGRTESDRTDVTQQQQQTPLPLLENRRAAGNWALEKPLYKETSLRLVNMWHQSAKRAAPHRGSGISSTWLFLTCTLYNKPGKTVKETVYLSSLSHFSKLQILSRAHRNPTL